MSDKWRQLSLLQPSPGEVNFNVSMKLNMENISIWTDDKKAALFAGIALVLAAHKTEKGELHGHK